jgi:hypothetical protein
MKRFFARERPVVAPEGCLGRTSITRRCRGRHRHLRLDRRSAPGRPCTWQLARRTSPSPPGSSEPWPSSRRGRLRKEGRAVVVEIEKTSAARMSGIVRSSAPSLLWPRSDCKRPSWKIKISAPNAAASACSATLDTNDHFSLLSLHAEIGSVSGESACKCGRGGGHGYDGNER